MPKVVHCKIAPQGSFVYVGRPTKWGNPYTHKDKTTAKYKVSSPEEAVAKFEEDFLNNTKLVSESKKELRDKDLACWCVIKGNEPCHARVLLRVANE